MRRGTYIVEESAKEEGKADEQEEAAPRCRRIAPVANEAAIADETELGVPGSYETDRTEKDELEVQLHGTRETNHGRSTMYFE
jgi:hypothetical protein